MRYVLSAWKALLEQQRPARVVLFMDDDLFDWRAFWSMSWRYQRRLREIGSQSWVSPPWLAEKYSGWNLVLARCCRQ